ncbi:acyltransferase family protein [Rhizobium sp. LC145]|uniref:acyltransferase n=1 Tax=Rhizobium sp. LC145 TaxID=1120688 RepID=UPI00062A4923|nr:acyltransferase family protein [Rhizobium sp. LC145]KKX28219.1 hypothetical protein YH62_19205 [Rhizobium sp. LC145]TKT58363.1 hypothetical protein FDR95_12200 [Rhizobiaceae bacterium LC148]
MQRDSALDNLRAVAIISVLIIHSIDTANNLSHIGRETVDWPIYQTLRAIGRLGVPLFLMVSGALILNRLDRVSDFYRKRLLQFVALIFILPFAYDFFNVYILGHSPAANLTQILRGRSGYAYQLWYLYVAFGLYIIAPLLQAITRTSRRDLLVVLAAVPIVWNFIPSTLAVFGITTHLPYLGLEFTGIYFFYFVYGYIAYRMNFLQNVPGIAIGAALVACLSLWVISQLQWLENPVVSGDGFMWYDNIFCLISSATTFELVRRIRMRSSAAEEVSQASFAIYLWHLFPFYFLSSFSADLLGTPWWILAVLMLVSGAAFGYALYRALRKLPYLNRLVT